jgi:hypothetical protein
MKRVSLELIGNFKPRNLIDAVVSTSGGQQGISVPQMRGRVRVLDALEAAPADADVFLLEDADFNLLSELMNAYPYNIAHKDLLAVIDRLGNSETVIAPKPESGT